MRIAHTPNPCPPRPTHPQAFMACCVVAQRFNLGPVFIIVTIIVLIVRNLGKRKEVGAAGVSEGGLCAFKCLCA